MPDVLLPQSGEKNIRHKQDAVYKSDDYNVFIVNVSNNDIQAGLKEMK
jgi:hypothetical protein